MRIAEVAVPVPLGRPLTYRIPDEFPHDLSPGARVVCELGHRRVLGVLLDIREVTTADPLPFDPSKLKSILQLLDPVPVLERELLSFLLELSHYYLAPIGEVLRLALPALERSEANQLTEAGLSARDTAGAVGRLIAHVQRIEPRDTGSSDAHEPAFPVLRGKADELYRSLVGRPLVPISELEKQWKSARAIVHRLAENGLVTLRSLPAVQDPYFQHAVPREPPPELNGPQLRAVERIAEALSAAGADADAATSDPKTAAGRGQGFLLFGVTGSGKTEVYLRAIAACRNAGRGALVLVPEIALTPQLVARFRARFGDDLAVLHSGIREKDRHGMWKRLRQGEIHVAIGARSAIFAPLRNLGLVIVDEEHDSSFKQEEGIRYHARDMALLRAHRASAVSILGSATPSLESEMLVRRGKLERLSLPDRAHATAVLPRVELVDLRRIGPGPGNNPYLSLPLHRAIEKTLAQKEQVILFLNRRGFAPSVLCEACGKIVTCKLCSVSLTYHRTLGGRLRCHYCDYEAPFVRECPECKAPQLALEGLGTEKLEATISELYPAARVARLDRDVAGGAKSEEILDRMRTGELDILVGTQMVTKGHDLPSVTLVGIINADAALSVPDFRAAERAFQLMVQVSGRAGRKERAGQVLIQTRDPENSAIVFAARHDVTGFLARELADREEVFYPPFARLALLRLDAVDEAELTGVSAELTATLRTIAAVQERKVEVLGPAVPPIARIRGRFRSRILLRSAERKPLRSVLLAAVRLRDKLPRTIRMVIDVDPVQMM